MKSFLSWKDGGKYRLSVLAGVLTLFSSCQSSLSLLNIGGEGGYGGCMSDGRFLEPQLARVLEHQFSEAWFEKDGGGWWRAHCIVFASRPNFRIVDGSLSIVPHDGEKRRGKTTFVYGGNTGEIKGRIMHVQGNVLVERTRTFSVMDVFLLSLARWKTDPSYMEIPLDFTYASSWKELPERPAGKVPVKR